MAEVKVKAREPEGRAARSTIRKPRIWVTAMVVALAMVGTASSGVAAAATKASAAEVDPATSPVSSTSLRWGNWAWNGTINYNPYSASGYVQYANLALLNLAAYSNSLRPGANPYLPELASSWNVKNHTITFHVRQQAKWQDGTPLTSRDVYNSLLLSGANLNAVWADISDVSTPNPHELVIKLFPWVITQNVMEGIFQVVILPTSQYGFLIPKGFEKVLLSYWKTYNFLHPTETSIGAASSSPAGKSISAVDTNLVQFNPSKLIGSGPYELARANANGVLYKKWMGWWDHSSIRVPWIEIVPSTASTMYGGMVTGSLDFQQSTQFTDPQVERINASTNGRYVFIPSPVQQESLVFHLATYPYGILEVRQAIAHLIDRYKLAQLDMGGKLIQDPPVEYPDGINQEMAKKYITKAQYKKMNPYKFDPSRAAQLLKSVGFTKHGGVWYTPKGKVWHVTITENAGNAQFVQDGIIIAKALRAFGIKADSVNVNSATYGAQQLAGAYAVSENFMDWGGTPNPIGDFAATFGGSQWNYPIGYNGKGPFNKPIAIGIGPVSDVPGLGRVNIAATLNKQLNTAPPKDWPRLTYSWARWINQNLPILPLYNNAFHESYNTNRYVNFPPTSAKWLWTGLGGAAQPVMWQQMGYLHLRHSS